MAFQEGAILDPAKHRAASRSFKLLMQRTIQKGKAPMVTALVELICTKIPGSSFSEVYRFFEGLPLFRHWIGDRIARELKGQGMLVQLEPYEATLLVLRDDIMFDQLGGYSITINQMGIELLLMPWRQSVSVIADGFAGTKHGNCFDGYPLFSANHGTGSNAGTARFSATALGAAVKAMRAQKDPVTQDDLLIEPTHVWYHIDEGDRVDDVLDKEFVMDATGVTTESNKWKGKLQKVPMRGLPAAASKYWGLLSLEEGNSMRPVIHRFMPGSDQLQEDESKNFSARRLQYGLEYWSKTVPGFPQYIYGSTGAVG